MQTWEEWKRHYHFQIQHIAGFEERFVDTILSKIPLVQPSDVIPQYHFIDHKKGNRYIDFVIIVSSSNSKSLLPIELDGKTKLDTYESFNDTLERQNDLIQQFGLLLRYSNKKMLNQPDEIINEISQLIQLILDKKDTDEIEKRNFEQYKQNMESQLADLSKQIQRLNQTSKQYKNEDISRLVEDKFQEQRRYLGFDKLEKQQQEISEQIRQIHTQLKQTSSVKSQINLPILLLIIIISVLLMGVFSIWKFNSNQITRNELPVVQEKQLGRVDNNVISSSQVNKFIGKDKVVCGYLAEISPFKQGVYLNLGDVYPNQEFSVVIWEKSILYFDAMYLKSLEKKDICIKGKINEYKGRIQIILEDKSQISVS